MKSLTESNWSASSRTKISVLEIRSTPREAKSSVLPGVPTTICGFLWWSCRFWLTIESPPIAKRTCVLELRREQRVAWIWRAISRVGVKTTAWIRFDSKFTFSRIAMQKTRVFPVPDFDFYEESKQNIFRDKAPEWRHSFQSRRWVTLLPAISTAKCSCSSSAPSSASFWDRAVQSSSLIRERRRFSNDPAHFVLFRTKPFWNEDFEFEFEDLKLFRRIIEVARFSTSFWL